MKEYTGGLYNESKMFYEILDNGFKIYIGSNQDLRYVQTEPFIPDHSKSYEENALAMCKELSEQSQKEPEPRFDMTESMYLEMQSNIDYLMLLNDSDSLSNGE